MKFTSFLENSLIVTVDCYKSGDPNEIYKYARFGFDRPLVFYLY